jgi:hypothetical protein
MMKMNTDPEWLRKMTELEDGCDVSVGGMEHAKLLERLCTPGASPPEDDTKWLPTADAINALPPGLRDYIHDLETRCDPAGDVAELACLRETVQALEVLIAELKAALHGS